MPQKIPSFDMFLGLFFCMVTDSKRKVITKKTSTKNDGVLGVKSEKSSSNVSVITKTTTPKVLVQSENITNNENILNEINDKHLLLKLICFIIMCVILLMTFFLSLKTYNAVNELSDYVQWRIQP